jgi:hypothetical protein
MHSGKVARKTINDCTLKIKNSSGHEFLIGLVFSFDNKKIKNHDNLFVLLNAGLTNWR